jgi:hypothetical protein
MRDGASPQTLPNPGKENLESLPIVVVYVKVPFFSSVLISFSSVSFFSSEFTAPFNGKANHLRRLEATETSMDARMRAERLDSRAKQEALVDTTRAAKDAQAAGNAREVVVNGTGAAKDAQAAGNAPEVVVNGDEFYFRESKPLLANVEVGECVHGKCLRASTHLSSGACLSDKDKANAFVMNVPDAEYERSWTFLDVRLHSVLKHAALSAEVFFTDALASEVEALMNEPGHSAGAASWQLAYLLAMRQEADEHGVCMCLMQGIDPFSESTLATMMWKLQPLDLFYFAIISQREWDIDECTVEEMWKRFVLLMMYPFANAGGDRLVLHKYICMANTTDEQWEGYKDNSASLDSSVNALYWSNDAENGLFLLEDVDERGEITVDYGQYVMPVEKRLETRKR